MPVSTRPRRKRTIRMDMQVNSDVEPEIDDRVRQGRQPDNGDEEDEEAMTVEVEALVEARDDPEDDDNELDKDEDEEDPGDDDDEEDQEDEIQSEADPDEPSSLPTAGSSRLKIKLKMPSQPASRYESPNVESEDSMSSDSRPSTRPMTTRQAVLASVLDSSHVSLAGSRQKKAPLNESELALRREETARKRKNLSEKKLEDEKAETINRLLRRQSRPRNKRTTAQHSNIDDVPPLTRSNSNSVYTPTGGKKGRKKGTSATEDQEQDDVDDEDGMEGVEDNDGEEQHEEERIVPTMYRWVSSARVLEGATEANMQITFSVPVSVLPTSMADTSPKTDLLMHERESNTRPTHCSAPGCGNPSRYRLVKDWTRGACGIHCLKVLETTSVA